MNRLMLILLMVGTLGVTGCGGSSSPPTNVRNEADWAQAQQKARAEIEPLEARLGVAESRTRERELAKSLYNALVAEEHETPTEREELEKGETPLG